VNWWLTVAPCKHTARVTKADAPAMLIRVASRDAAKKEVDADETQERPRA